MTASSPGTSTNTNSGEAPALGHAQLAWLAAAVFVVSAGFGALMPVLPSWLGSMMRGASTSEVARHVGLFTGVYAAGVLIGAPLWGVISDRTGRGRILIIGLVGYVASLLLFLLPALTGIWELYVLRAATGFFVAAVVPVVSALVAEHTPEEKRARRFAWLSAVSLLGFLFGPGLIQIANGVATLVGAGTVTPTASAHTVILLSAVLGGVMMLGLARALPAWRASNATASKESSAALEGHAIALCWLNGMVTLVLAGFELGIVLQGQEHADMSTRLVSIMFAECSLVMLVVNGALFLTGMLEKISSQTLVGLGLILASAGLAVMAWHHDEGWLYFGISLTSGGTGLVLPVIAYLAAGMSRQKLGSTMGLLAAAAGLGQTLGSSSGGWIFGALGQGGFGVLIVPLVAMFLLLVVRPGWWSAVTSPESRHGTGHLAPDGP